MDKLEEICRVLPCQVRRLMKKLDLDMRRLQEIRLRAFRPLIILYDNRECFVSPEGKQCQKVEQSYVVTQAEIKESFELLSEFSTYAFEEEMRLGYITISGGHRVGIAGRSVVEQGCLRNMKNVSFINIRVANERLGCADSVIPYLFENDTLLHTMIISPPKGGKTTLLRDIIRQISDGSASARGRNVGVVDERSEICACYRGIPQNDVGIRTDVLDACPKAQGLMRLVRSMSPEVVAVDEIGTSEDYEAVEYVLRCGCSVLATVHGSGLEDICRNRVLARAVEAGCFRRYIILDGGSKPGRIISIIDESGKRVNQGNTDTFDAAVNKVDEVRMVQDEYSKNMGNVDDTGIGGGSRICYGGKSKASAEAS